MKENINDLYSEVRTSFKGDFHWLVDRGFVAVGPDMSEWRKVSAIDNPLGEDSIPMLTTVVMVPVKEPARDSLPKDEVTYDHCLLFGKNVLFVDGRFNREGLPKGLYAYDLRGSDDDPGEPVTLERSVLVNHAGTVISAEPLLEDDVEYRELGEGLDFQDDAMTLRIFIEMYSLEWEHSLWKWLASRTVLGDDSDLTVRGRPADSPAEAIESMLRAVDEKTRKEDR